ncbi:MAG: hypothetical protein R3338_10390 [Thermoanaerobaculia bacterium]|nr:hypothetical protein [Thermoanaerobaculia bacterium]
MQDRLDQNIRRHYAEQRLDPDRLEELKREISARTERQRADRGHSGNRMTLAAAAAAILVAIGGLYLFTQVTPQSDPTTAQIAEELSTQAALIHNKQLDMEFEATGYGELKQSMEKLDFTPVEPSRFEGMNLQVVGARYGMLEGQPAVQITLLEPSGRTCTLYQMRPVGKLAGISEETREVDGLAIDMWKEKGLLMVLARPAA